MNDAVSHALLIDKRDDLLALKVRDELDWRLQTKEQRVWGEYRNWVVNEPCRFFDDLHEPGDWLLGEVLERHRQRWIDIQLMRGWEWVNGRYGLGVEES